MGISNLLTDKQAKIAIRSGHDEYAGFKVEQSNRNPEDQLFQQIAKE